MNRGAILVKEQFFTPEEVGQIAQDALNFSRVRTRIHEMGALQDLKWYQVPLADKNLPWMQKIYDTLGIPDAELAAFYYLDPGAILHPHRDLTGASLNKRIRFHIPVITNDQIEFKVSKQLVKMRPGELWCLDTSYLHSVENKGDASRVHIVLECGMNEEMAQLLPRRSYKDAVHSAFFMGILLSKFSHSLVVNSIKNPAYLRAQFRMIGRFVGWRFLKKTDMVRHGKPAAAVKAAEGEQK
jgi:hypothetical protein